KRGGGKPRPYDFAFNDFVFNITHGSIRFGFEFLNIPLTGANIIWDGDEHKRGGGKPRPYDFVFNDFVFYITYGSIRFGLVWF
ncbi:MAG: hypothetical protein LBE18_02220, partial [Planctomycetaceae bacterium]|nr:hypothetical protein [Planctomycetaceae bacterium]